MKSLVDLILEDAMKENELYYGSEEKDSFGEILSLKKKDMLVNKIYELMEICVDNCDDIKKEPEYFQDYKKDIEEFIVNHIAKSVSYDDFSSCINKALKAIKEDLWLDRKQSGLVNRFVRFLKQM